MFALDRPSKALRAESLSANIPNTDGPLPLIIEQSAPDSSIICLMSLARSRTGSTADSKMFLIPAAISGSLPPSILVKQETLALRDEKSYISSSL